MNNSQYKYLLIIVNITNHWALLLHLSNILIVHTSAVTINASLPNCLPGCKCSPESQATYCCLINPSNKLWQLYESRQSSSPASTSLTSSATAVFTNDLKQCGSLVNLHTIRPIWRIHCLPNWQQLKLQLFESSWLLPPPSQSTVDFGKQQSSRYPYHHLTVHNYSCTSNLEGLSIHGGASRLNLGLRILDPLTFRQKLFPTPGELKLQYLTIEDTDLAEISAGFLDSIKAHQLTELTIRRNTHLTDTKLGIGWLAYADNLHSLDLSYNSLYSINLARWGFPSTRPTRLKLLNLNGNRLQYLKPNSFIRVSNLVQLNLASNNLHSLTLNIFNGLYKLKFLDLQKNQLKLPGLATNPGASLSLYLPELRELRLSHNPLLYNVLSEQSSLTGRWWLTERCPQQFRSLYLENIERTKSSSFSAHRKLNLPLINWTNCPSLTDLHFSRESAVSCIDQVWFGLPAGTSKLPTRYRVHPKGLQLCTPKLINRSEPVPTSSSSLLAAENHMWIATRPPDNPFPIVGGKLSSMHTTSIAMSSAYWHISTKEKFNQDSIRRDGLQLRKTNMISSWIVLSLIIVLIFTIILLIISSVVYCLKYLNRNLKATTLQTSLIRTNNYHSEDGNYLQHQQQKLIALNDMQRFAQQMKMSQDLSWHSALLQNPTHCQAYNFDFMAPQSEMQYPLFYHAHCPSPCASCTQLKYPNSQPVSPVDSGLEDLTPLTMQYSHNSPRMSPLSVRNNGVRVSRHRKRPRRRTRAPVFAKYPPTSSMSPRKLHNMYNTNAVNANKPTFWFSPISSLTNQMNVAATSTEDVSIGPASTSADTPDACSVISDKHNSANQCKEK